MLRFGIGILLLMVIMLTGCTKKVTQTKDIDPSQSAVYSVDEEHENITDISDADDMAEESVEAEQADKTIGEAAETVYLKPCNSYQDILDNVYEVIVADYTTRVVESDDAFTYVGVAETRIGQNVDETLASVGYTLFDVDGNGVDELMKHFKYGRCNMKIAVIGPGAMGLLYGAKLSACAKVVLVGNNADHVKEINDNGITLKRDGEEKVYHVPAVLSGQIEEPADLIILFTKAYLTEEALEQNKALIGSNTVLLTLQNGAGHEEVLSKFTDKKNILIGTTAQGSYRENAHTIVNSGLGDTVVGAVSDGFAGIEEIGEAFEQSGFPCKTSDNIKQMVWNKLMINASSSVLSGVLGVNQGYVAENSHAWEICKDLIREICMTATGEGYPFDEKEQIERIENHLTNAPGGYTSIYADLKNGRKTEVDYISGAVVRAAKKQGKTVPTQELMVHMVHAMEDRDC